LGGNGGGIFFSATVSNIVVPETSDSTVQIRFAIVVIYYVRDA